MTTVLLVLDSRGTRRCDARCHESPAASPCDCICGGRYHGVGDAKAQRQVLADLANGVIGAPVDQPSMELGV